MPFEYASRRLADVLRSIANARPFKWGGTALPAGKDWFILQDGALGGPDGVDVWHVSGGRADYIGNGDRMLFELTSIGTGRALARRPHDAGALREAPVQSLRRGSDGSGAD